MANHEILTDDYVAGLLAKDAKESTIKYSALGLGAFTQSKPPANKPKPNTRFLRNIIKDTDSHNAALLAKEAAESKARLQSLSGNEYREEKATRIGGGDIRRRQLGDIAAILGGRPSKRRRTDTLRENDNGSRRVNTSSEDEEPIKKLNDGGSRNRFGKDEFRGDDTKIRSHKIKGMAEERRRSQKKDHRRERSDSEDRGRNDHRRRHRDGSEDRSRRSDRKRRESRSRSPKEHRSKSSRHRQRSPKARLSPDPDQEKFHRSNRYHASPSSKARDSKSNEKTTRTEISKPEYDSDPLDDIIGPRPPPIPEVRSRGRGAMSFGSGIDSRFAASYDPTADVQLDPDEENDWDQALEALRDRQKWKQQGADRLRAAGFTEDEITKWEKGGEKREEDVKWTRHGESREWDRGKIVDDEGVVNVEPSWGRLKDN